MKDWLIYFLSNNMILWSNYYLNILMLVVWEIFGKNIFIMILDDFPKEIES